jgi:hypothetical protein
LKCTAVGAVNNGLLLLKSSLFSSPSRTRSFSPVQANLTWKASLLRTMVSKATKFVAQDTVLLLNFRWNTTMGCIMTIWTKFRFWHGYVWTVKNNSQKCYDIVLRVLYMSVTLCQILWKNATVWCSMTIWTRAMFIKY